MRILLSLLAVFALAATVAEAGPRFKVVTPIRGKDFATGRAIVIPPNHGFTFEIVDGGTLHPRMRVFDLGGLEVQADFPMNPSDEAKKAALKDNIIEGLKATSEGAKVETDGCCDVMDNKPKEPEVTEGDKAEAKPTADSTGEQSLDITSPPEDFVDSAKVAEKKPAEKAPEERPKEVPVKPVEKRAEVLKVVPVPRDQAEVKETPRPEPELKIESPPEDFVDMSGKSESSASDELPENVPVPEKKPEIANEEEQPAEVETKPEEASADEAGGDEADLSQRIAELKDVPVPTPNPRKNGRSPALEKPEAELLALPEKNIPIPTPRPQRKEKELVAGGAKDSHDSPPADDTAKPDEKPAEREPASTFLCRAYRTFRDKGVPEEPLKQAMTFLERHESKFKNNRYFSIADYSQNSRRKRFYLLDLQNFTVTQDKVSHGAGRGSSADPDRDGMLDACGDSGSKRTRAGFFEVGDYYFSSHGRYKWPLLTRKPPRNGMRLIGLSPGVNSSAFSDGYVMHEAKYNAGGDAIMGRSNGCPAFVPGHGAPIIAKLRGGSLHYNYAPVCRTQHRRVLQQVSGWESFCR